MDTLGFLLLFLFSISYCLAKPFVNLIPFAQKDVDQEVKVEEEILKILSERERLLDAIENTGNNHIFEEKKAHILEVPIYQKLIQDALDEYRYRQSFVPENRPG